MRGLKVLLWRHLSSKSSRPAVRWMNRFALLATALGLFSWLTVLNVMEGLQGEIRRQHLSAKAHLLLETPLRADLADVQKKIQENLGENYLMSDLKLQVEGLLEPLSDGKVYTGSGVVIEGSDEVEPGKIILGYELATSLDGISKKTFRLRNVWRLEGAPLELEPVGIRRTDLFDVDRFHVWVSLSDLENWLGSPALKSRLEIKLKDPYQSTAALAIAQKVDPAFVDWKMADSALWYSLDLEKKAMAFSLFFVVLFGAMAVSSSLSLRIAEKRREIGLLRAVGTRAKDIFWLYELEGLILGAIGLTIGLVLSYGGSWLLQNFGMLPDFFYSRSLPVEWSWSRAALLWSLSMLTVALVTYVPARKLLKWDITSLLKS